MENKEQIIQDILKGMEGIGGIPSNQEFYTEFDFRLRSALGIQSSQPINSGWVSVEDRLPDGLWGDTEQEYFKKYSQQVNVFVDNGSVGTAAYNRETKKWFIGDLSEKHYQELDRTNVTHWKELPQSPKQSCPQCKTEYTKEELLTNEHCFKCGFEMKGF